jgi:CheY-like chemotaxis protein
MPLVLVVDDSAVDRRLVGGLLDKEADWRIEYAENGTQALQRMKKATPDIVVTDLQMPEMDGLNLVRAVRLNYDDVPVILMTAHGSESLAIEALEQGAAGYVPKSQAAEILLDTVKHVLTMLRAERSYEQLIQCLDRTEFAFTLRNDASLIDPLVDLVQQMIFGMGLCDAIERVRVGVAFEQALLNALFRGNLAISQSDLQQERERMLRGQGGPGLVEQRCSQSPYCDRRIFVDVNITKKEAKFVVRDEGEGFDTSMLPGPGDPRALEREGGRGLVLIKTFMDDVQFNDVGNQITMTKRRRAAS